MKLLTNLFMVLLLIGTISSCKKNESPKAEVNAASENSNTNEGTIYNVNLESSKVLWEGSKPTGKHTGSINLQSGTLTVAENKVVGGEFVLDMNTITDLDLEGDMKSNLEAHLKGTAEGKEDDFFNVAKYPTATFEITKVTGIANDNDASHLVYGNLKIRDITKEIGFKAKITISDAGINVSTPQFSIDRTDFGIKFMSKTFFDDLKDKFVNDNINLQIKLLAA